MMLLTLAVLGIFAFNNQLEEVDEGHPQPVIVELFTSQGCSSCPSADIALQEIMDEAERKNQPIYGLSFHVSYWNYLGWKDPYSKKDFTARQYQYAEKRHSQVYTPQTWINGSREFVGSRKRDIAETIQTQSKKPKSHRIEINDFTTTGNNLQFAYEVDGEMQGIQLNLALVQKEGTNYIKRGENRGRTLSHGNIVREFVTTTNPKGKIQFEIPDDLDINEAILIAYTQKQSTFEVTGAARSNILQAR